MNLSFKDVLVPIYLFTFYLFFLFLTYKQIFTQNYPSDMQAHITFIHQYFQDSSTLYIPHPLWHISVKFFSYIFGLSIEVSAVIFSSAIVLLNVFIVLKITENILNAKQNFNIYKLIAITTIIVLIGPLCIPWFNPVIYWGQGSPNIWHNVTIWMVKPFALLSVFFVIKAISNNKKNYFIICLILSIISIFAKPSFIIMFIPSLFLFLLIKRHYKKEAIVFYFILSILSVLILLYQYLSTFTDTDTKIIFDFLGVWSTDSSHIPISLLFALAFPLSFVFLHSKILHDDLILFNWIMLFVGLAMYISLAQTGKLYEHGNFGWSYRIAMSLLYTFSIIKYFELFSQLTLLKRYTLFSLLLIQFSTGLYYFTKVLLGHHPIYLKLII